MKIIMNLRAIVFVVLSLMIMSICVNCKKKEQQQSIKGLVCSDTVDQAVRLNYTVTIENLIRTLNVLKKLNELDVTCELDISEIVENFSILKKYCESENNNTYYEQQLYDSIGDDDQPPKQWANYTNAELYELIPSVYEENFNYSYKVFDIINTIYEPDQKLISLRVLMDELVKSDEIYSTATAIVAYQLSLIVNTVSSSEGATKNLQHLLKYIPSSLQTFPWNSSVQIISAVKSGLIYGSSSHYDNLRREVYTSYNKNDIFLWKFIPDCNGTCFSIKSEELGEYLYADNNFFDVYSRKVFTWKVKHESLEFGRWIMEPIKGAGHFRIRNVYWNEYLYLENNLGNVHTHRVQECEGINCMFRITKIVDRV